MSKRPLTTINNDSLSTTFPAAKKLRHDSTLLDSYWNSDILLELFSFLSVTDLCSTVNLVNKDWKSVAEHPSLWFVKLQHLLLDYSQREDGSDRARQRSDFSEEPEGIDWRQVVIKDWSWLVRSELQYSKVKDVLVSSGEDQHKLNNVLSISEETYLGSKHFTSYTIFRREVMKVLNLGPEHHICFGGAQDSPNPTDNKFDQMLVNQWFSNCLVVTTPPRSISTILFDDSDARTSYHHTIYQVRIISPSDIKKSVHFHLEYSICSCPYEEITNTVVMNATIVDLASKSPFDQKQLQLVSAIPEDEVPHDELPLDHFILLEDSETYLQMNQEAVNEICQYLGIDSFNLLFILTSCLITDLDTQIPGLRYCSEVNPNVSDRVRILSLQERKRVVKSIRSGSATFDNIEPNCNGQEEDHLRTYQPVWIRAKGSTTNSTDLSAYEELEQLLNSIQFHWVLKEDGIVPGIGYGIAHHSFISFKKLSSTSQDSEEGNREYFRLRLTLDSMSRTELSLRMDECTWLDSECGSSTQIIPDFKGNREQESKFDDLGCKHLTQRDFADLLLVCMDVHPMIYVNADDEYHWSYEASAKYATENTESFNQFSQAPIPFKIGERTDSDKEEEEEEHEEAEEEDD